MQATIAVAGQHRGTITNAEGWFSLPVRGGADSIRVSYVGYATVKLALAQHLDGKEILLKRVATQLAEVTILPDEDLHARVVAASTWLRRVPSARAKAFYQLETHSDEQPVELLQACYTAHYRGGALEKLTLKQGRIGIAAKADRYFINHNTGGALLLFQPLWPNKRFPESPLAFTSARALRKRYHAERIARADGPNGMDHIRLTPKDGSSMAFTLDLWLDRGAAGVRAFELACVACSPHPFEPLLPDGRIDAIDLRYRQTWDEERGRLPELIELDYTVDYAGPGFQDRFRTTAILHAYERDAEFVPVLFPERKGLKEYPSIAWTPYDSTFWSEQALPIPTERQARDHAFIMAHDVARNDWYRDLSNRHFHLRSAYLPWSDTTRLDSTCLAGTPRVVQRGSGRIPEIHYATHLYLDLDTTAGTLRHRSISVFDCGDSWNMFPWSLTTKVLVNIFFDLAEIERRNMETRLRQPGVTLEQARQIHKEHTARMRQQQARFARAVASGEIYMIDWNRQVRAALGINNLDLLKERITEP